MKLWHITLQTETKWLEAMNHLQSKGKFIRCINLPLLCNNKNCILFFRLYNEETDMWAKVLTCPSTEQIDLFKPISR